LLVVVNDKLDIPSGIRCASPVECSTSTVFSEVFPFIIPTAGKAVVINSVIAKIHIIFAFNISTSSYKLLN
jgi:hypothetical protein